MAGFKPLLMGPSTPQVAAGSAAVDVKRTRQAVAEVGYFAFHVLCLSFAMPAQIALKSSKHLKQDVRKRKCKETAACHVPTSVAHTRYAVSMEKTLGSCKQLELLTQKTGDRLL